MGKGGLGNGLDSLFDDNSSDVQGKLTLRVSEIEPNREQPRKRFDDEAIAALADSIRDHGMIQPILVRQLQNGSYQIVAGERRWRAARMLGMDEVPVVVRDLTDFEAMQLALIENLQRENLNPIEEALGYRELMDAFDMTQEAVAQTVGRSRSAIANSLRMLNLPESVQKLLESGDISIGHAKALAGFSDEAQMIAYANRAAEGKLTVRAIEKLAAKEETEVPEKSNTRIDSYFTEMELSLHSQLGRRVKVDYAKNKGALILEFYDKDDLAALAEQLTK